MFFTYALILFLTFSFLLLLHFISIYIYHTYQSSFYFICQEWGWMWEYEKKNMKENNRDQFRYIYIYKNYIERFIQSEANKGVYFYIYLHINLEWMHQEGERRQTTNFHKCRCSVLKPCPQTPHRTGESNLEE